MTSSVRGLSRSAIGCLTALILVAFAATDALAQDWTFTLKQRRANDHICVEIWGKAQPGDATRLGEASLTLDYNSTYLRPTTTTAGITIQRTDSVAFDVDVANPVVDIVSSYNSANGYNSLGAQAYSSGPNNKYGLEVRMATLGQGGLALSSTGRGSFIGKLWFEIIGSPTDASLADITWNTNTSVGDLRIFDHLGNDVESQVTFVDPDAFTVVGITLLNPNGPSEVVDRDKVYASVNFANNGGYPVYFERSALDLSGTSGTNATAYVLEYSLNGGSAWTEFGRVAETTRPTVTLANVDLHVSGEISTIAGSRIITTMTGASLTTSRDITAANFYSPLRVVWSSNALFSARSEDVRLRITQLTQTPTASIDSRSKLTPFDISDNSFVMGRLFFLQLDGATNYGRSAGNYSNATQLTAETWINLNSYGSTGDEIGVLASSAGALDNASDEEGAWMLYLKDGRYPAFRAREIEGRGPNGYIGVLESTVALPQASDSSPLGSAHAGNWVHLAATVANGTITLYVNGEIVDQLTNAQAADIRMGVDQAATNHPIWAGINPNVSVDASDYLNAGLKGIKIWRTALTQDEIRARVAGIPNPADTRLATRINRALEIYWTLEGVRQDAASDAAFQNGTEDVQFWSNGAVDNSVARFRPDQPHINLTSPVGCEGVSNSTGATFSVRWIGYGIGTLTTASATADVDLQFSLDDGTSWTYIRGTTGTQTTANLGGPNGQSVDLETGEIQWMPYRNTGTYADGSAGLSLNPLPNTASSVSALLRIRGRNGSEQNVIDISQAFTIANNFAFERTTGQVISVDKPSSAEAFSISGQSAFFEAWVRPYRFPTAAEGGFPILSKVDGTTQEHYYSLNLLPSGRLEFRITDTNGDERIAVSDVNEPLEKPNSVSVDSAWTHVGVYVNIGDGTSGSDIRFYIDGAPQSVDTTITNQLGSAIVMEQLNSAPFHIGYQPSYVSSTGSTISQRGFLGAMREIRFWNGDPNDNAATGSVEPNALTLFVQGVQAVSGEDLLTASSANLVASFAMTGGSFVANGFDQSIASNSASIVARQYSGTGCYRAQAPYLKLVEPSYRQQVRNIETALRVRWVGFDYSGFTVGTNAPSVAPSLEYSVRGGGGLVIQPYQHVSSPFWSALQAASLSLPATGNYAFNGTGTGVQYAGLLNVSAADPDPDDDEVYGSTTAALSAALTNARLRLSATTGTITTGGTVVGTIRSEGPLFTIVPQSNFTVRAVLEGYHTSVTGAALTNIGTAFSNGGLRISLYNDNAGTPGALAATGESEFQYDALGLDPATRDNSGLTSSTFANVPYVFAELEDGDYWVVVEHINHLPIMSRFAAPFIFSGDDRATYAIESGWDFQSWNGTNGNVLATAAADPYAGAIPGRFTAYGNSINVTTSNLPGYSDTGLIFNEGESGLSPSTNALAGLVGGDVERDGQINAADRVQVSQDLLNTAQRSDINGDGVVNAVDRDIVIRNFGKISSILTVDFPSGMIDNGDDDNNGNGISSDIAEMIRKGRDRDPFTYVDPTAPEESAAILEAANRALDNFGGDQDRFERFKAEKRASDRVLAGGVNYIVTGIPHKSGDIVEVDLYIRNRGASFGLGNATFAVNYSSSMLEFEGMQNTSTNPWAENPGIGYSSIVSGPQAGSNRPNPNVRSIDVRYDSYARLQGAQVPTRQTLIGTLRFRLRNSNDNGRPIYFNWSNATAVLAINGQNLTGDGEFQPIRTLLPYSVELLAPNGGERWRAGGTHVILWDNKGADLVFVQYSFDGGKTWTTIGNGPVEANKQRLNWLIPTDVTTDVALVRIVDEQSGEELDRSESTFGVAPAKGSISRPAPTDDIYVAGSVDNIEWTTTGIDQVTFQFSGDGGANWQSLNVDGQGSNGPTAWVVPGGFNTKEAVVRMIDKNTNEEIARSGLFKVMSGDLTFREPREGDRYDMNTEQRIRWSFEKDVQLFDIDLSVNGGQTWTPLEQGVTANDFFTMWTTPANVATDNAQLRAYFPGDPELEYDRSPFFGLGPVSSVEQAAAAGYLFNDIYPNPIDGSTSIKFTVPVQTQVTLTIFNELGERVATPIEGRMYAGGTHSFDFDAYDLAPGAYFMRLDVGEFTLYRKAIVAR